MASYRFCQWDHELQRWDTIERAGSLFALRRVIRYYREDWDDASILVQHGRDKIGTRRRKRQLVQAELFA